MAEAGFPVVPSGDDSQGSVRAMGEAQSIQERLMREAIRCAVEKMRAGQGGPFGAVVVKDGVIVGWGWNRVTATNDPSG